MGRVAGAQEGRGGQRSREGGREGLAVGGCAPGQVCVRLQGSSGLRCWKETRGDPGYNPREPSGCPRIQRKDADGREEWPGDSLKFRPAVLLVPR